MRLIDADTVVHWQSYDDEHETFPEHTGTIAEFLDSMTDEGCPEPVDAVNRIRNEINAEIAELHCNSGEHSYDVQVNAIMIVEGLRRALRIVEEIFLKDGDGNDS